jgi:hypothetical protein
MSPDAASSASDAWTREALRLYGRYQREIVEALGLCPWAARARTESRLDVRIVLGREGRAFGASLDAIAALAPRVDLEVIVLVYPRLDGPREAFDAFVGRLRDADAARHAPGRIPFMSAAFHPAAEIDTDDAERLIPFLRRTPDPSLQLVRASVLEDVRSHAPQGTQFVDVAAIEASLLAGADVQPLRERIARTNLATTLRLGAAELTARLDDIRKDRDRTYRNLPPLDEPSD